ncbi:MAG: hypothetical protein P8M73_02190 [Luminiphilus sp.]|nr:hypothetical protein [Luminiphilus sp.]
MRPTIDFSGHWEIDYARTDSVDIQLNAKFREIQRELRRRNEAAERGAPYQGSPIGDVDSLLALAKMAEMVTQSALLEVRQDDRSIWIERENSFALTCAFDDPQRAGSRLGQEICWWDGVQWHFVIDLPDGLRIKHQFSRSEDGLSLAQRTVLSNPRSGSDFAVSRVFGRYDPSGRGYTCRETLSRGKVCTTEEVE